MSHPVLKVVLFNVYLSKKKREACSFCNQRLNIPNFYSFIKKSSINSINFSISLYFVIKLNKDKLHFFCGIHFQTLQRWKKINIKRVPVEEKGTGATSIIMRNKTAKSVALNFSNAVTLDLIPHGDSTIKLFN